MVAERSVVHRDPEIQGGVPVFRGTRVPLRNLIDYLEAGDSLEGFLDDFPWPRFSRWGGAACATGSFCVAPRLRESIPAESPGAWHGAA